MNRLNKIVALFTNKLRARQSDPAQDVVSSMNGHEQHLHDATKLAKQRLYEQWVCLETWLLFTEALPLLLGIAPDEAQDIDETVRTEIAALCLHAKDCVQKNLLPIINRDDVEQQWRVKPTELYRWATVSRISIPVELSGLMAFVMQTVLAQEQGDATSQQEKTTLALQQHRAIVLGAAVTVLTHQVDLIKTDQAILAKLIAAQIMENKSRWFGEHPPLLTQTAMVNLIDHYLKQAQ